MKNYGLPNGVWRYKSWERGAYILCVGDKAINEMGYDKRNSNWYTPFSGMSGWIRISVKHYYDML